ncbi:MAG: phage tail tape measure protein, partial [Desulfovibrionaceae bacterium]|nr:phage tail tape measure protein [Desulfovibrionaceae bacterium]
MARDISVNFALGASLNPGFKGSMSAAKSEIAGLARGIRRLESSSVGKLGADFAAQKSKIRGLGTELQDAKSRLAALRAQADASGGAAGSLARQIAQAERRVQGLSGSLRRSSEAYREHIASVRTAEGSVRNLSRNYQGLAADIERARRRQEALSANLARRDALREQRSDLRGRITGTVGTGMAAAAPAALSIGFEDAMARVGAVSKATDAQMVALTAKAREMGRDTRYSASQAAEGMGYLAMAGFNAQQQIDAIGGVLNVAAAAGADLGRASDIVSNGLTGFGLAADQAGRVGDVLTETFTSSNTTLESLGETLKYVAPVAKAAGANIEFVAAVAGVMGDAGIQGSMAGTAMRSMFTRLVAPARDAQKHMSKMGITAQEMAEIMADPETQAAARHIR